MSYLQQLQATRKEIERCLERRDVSGLKLAVIKYAKILREVQNKTQTYKDRALVSIAASNYEVIAAYIAKEGISNRVINAIKNNGTGISNSDPCPKDRYSHTAPASRVDTATSSLSTSPSSLAEPPLPLDKAIPNKASSPQQARLGNDIDWTADIFEKYLSATVSVETESGQGTGFFISDAGYLLTNHHVVFSSNKLCDEIFVKSGDGKISARATFIDASQKYDIALLRIAEVNTKTPYIPIIDNFEEVRSGSSIVLIGNTLNWGLQPVSGTVRLPHGSIKDDTVVYTAMTNKGDSGSPLINRCFKCVGIHKARETEEGKHGTRGIAYATSAGRIRALVNGWAKKHRLDFAI